MRYMSFLRAVRLFRLLRVLRVAKVKAGWVDDCVVSVVCLICSNMTNIQMIYDCYQTAIWLLYGYTVKGWNSESWCGECFDLRHGLLCWHSCYTSCRLSWDPRWHLMAPDGTCHTTHICIYLSCSTLGTMNPRRITDRGFLMLNIAKSLLVVTVINHFTATCCNSFEHWLGQAKMQKVGSEINTSWISQI